MWSEYCVRPIDNAAVLADVDTVQNISQFASGRPCQPKPHKCDPILYLWAV